jgi:hypothetical protein
VFYREASLVSRHGTKKGVTPLKLRSGEPKM